MQALRQAYYAEDQAVVPGRMVRPGWHPDDPSHHCAWTLVRCRNQGFVTSMCAPRSLLGRARCCRAVLQLLPASTQAGARCALHRPSRRGS